MSVSSLYCLSKEPLVWYNMSGDYTYLTEGYYHSMDRELEGIVIKPTIEESLDAYIVPLALKKAEQAGIKIPASEMVMDEVSGRVLAYAVNPFSTKQAVINAPEESGAGLKALTMGGKYAVLCQFLPSNYQIVTVRSVMGKTVSCEFQEFVSAVFLAFQLPLMRITLIVHEQDYLFSSIKPLSLKELDRQERAWLEEIGRWQK